MPQEQQSAGNIKENMADTVKRKADEAIDKVDKIKDKTIKEISDSQFVGDYRVEEIGKPFKFSEFIDPEERTYKFLATRMNIVDLYPCNYAQAYAYNSENKKSIFKYAIGYEAAMNRYKRMCIDYLGAAAVNPPSGVRLFLTDDTVVTDGVMTNYQPNFFQNLADGVSKFAQSITNIGRSMHSYSYDKFVDSAISSIDTNAISNKVASMGLSDKHSDMFGGIVDGLKEGAAIVLKGNRLSLPKIWSESSYTPSFSVTTKLFSPYGSPKAIQEFIIKPLTMILLMGVPHTEDMVSYGKPFALTIRAWGSSYLTLGGITSITLQRGGSDTLYNIYKQPLVINVNIEFTSLVDGIAAFATDRKELEIPKYEKESYAGTGHVLTLNSNSQSIDGEILPTVMPTLGNIIRSMQPVQFEDLSIGYGPQRSTRDTTMIGGNGSSTPDFGSGFLSSIISPFNAAYSHAMNSATIQANFGSGFVGGVLDTANTLAYGVGAISRSVGKTLNGVNQLGYAIGGGSYAGSQLAKNVQKTSSTIHQTNSRINGTMRAANNLNRSIGYAVNSAGSLLNLAV